MNDVSVHNRSLGLDILHYSGTTIPPTHLDGLISLLGIISVYMFI